jgi:hypothetical protein
MNTHIPLYSYDLIDELDKLFPERCPDPEDSEREIWMKAGRRELIRSLLIWKEKEENSTPYNI